MINIEDIYKSFGSLTAVCGISGHIAKGEVVGLLGPNGAGKTTTMRMITGFLKPTKGAITINNLCVLQNPKETKSLIGYLPEQAPLYYDMEVVEFLEYVGTLQKIDSNKLSHAVGDVVSLCGLKKVVGRNIGQLSRGYKQRVGLAQAMIHQPPILILDEPTTGLDPHQIQEIRSLIKEIGREKTVILSSHIMQEVEAVCGRAWIISQGKLVGSGTLEELSRQKKGGGRFFVTLKGERQDIESKITNLPDFNIESLNGGDATWHKLILKESSGKAGPEEAEKIFSWVVSNQWKLSELRCEQSSLEDVFLELTQ